MLVQGLQGPRQEPIILISWSLWVSINSAWRDESFELGNRSVAPLFPGKNVSSPEGLGGAHSQLGGTDQLVGPRSQQ